MQKDPELTGPTVIVTDQRCQAKRHVIFYGSMLP